MSSRLDSSVAEVSSEINLAISTFADYCLVLALGHPTCKRSWVQIPVQPLFFWGLFLALLCCLPITLLVHRYARSIHILIDILSHRPAALASDFGVSVASSLGSLRGKFLSSSLRVIRCQGVPDPTIDANAPRNAAGKSQAMTTQQPTPTRTWPAPREQEEEALASKRKAKPTSTASAASTSPGTPSSTSTSRNQHLCSRYLPTLPPIIPCSRLTPSPSTGFPDPGAEALDREGEVGNRRPPQAEREY